MALPNGAMVMAPPPMSATFLYDWKTDSVRLEEPWWPARLLVDGRFLSLAWRGECIAATEDGDTLVFRLANGTATYRRVQPDPESKFWYVVRDVYEFDCVSCSRDMTDG